MLTTKVLAPSVPFRSAALLAASAKAGVRELPAQADEREPSGPVGELRESLEDHVALGHAGCPEGGLYEQAPRAAAPFLSVDFARLGGANMEALHLRILEP